mmetsp:Transcript_9412/g.23849  ORF Transcript_9412/g.23849 Transcript_9412/m.23849 type:complete len:386 (-) Transcript_9412:19-1176(-)
MACPRFADILGESDNALTVTITGDQSFLTIDAVFECIERTRDEAVVSLVQSCTSQQMFSLFCAGKFLLLPAVSDACRLALCDSLDPYTVPLAAWVAHQHNDEELMTRCYWFLKEMLGSRTVPSAWDENHGSVRVADGVLHRAFEGSRTVTVPLSAFESVVEADTAKKARLLTPSMGYTLCQLHRIRQADGAYPHVYEVRLDHNDETILVGHKESEQSVVHIFSQPGVTSQFAECYMGVVEPGFWGTSFHLFDSGASDAVASLCKGLPLRRRRELCSVGYETNLLGDCPRKITVQVECEDGKVTMENLAPKWDSKIGSYALPFFGRVKLASAKNFQLVVDGNRDNIFFIFGKVQKDVFALDFRNPLSPLDAFAIAISSLAKKRAVA